MRSLIFVTIVSALLTLSACGSENNKPSESITNTMPDPGNENVEEIIVEPNAYTIAITSSGFTPALLEINKGDAVVFKNEDEEQHWPASAAHPTHEKYPGTSIKKCFNTASPIFDACKGLKKDESFSFIFNERGEWSYHDHLNPSFGGKIIVK